MDRRNLTDLGEEIKDIVQDAVNTRDFGQLNRDIGNTVNSALNEVKSSLGLNHNNRRNRFGQNDYSQNAEDTYYNNQDWNQQPPPRPNDNANYNNGNYNSSNNRSYQRRYQRNYSRDYSRDYNRTRNEVQKNKSVVVASKDKVPVGKVSGVLYSVLGGIGIGTFGIAIIVLSILATVLDNQVFAPIVIGLTPLLFGSIILSFLGSGIRKRLMRYKQYVTAFRNHNYCMIKDIAASSGQSVNFIVKDLRKMIIVGMFPEGHIDEQKTCFMLNNESYDQYLKLQESNRMKQMETQQKQKEEQQKPNTENNEFSKAIQEGKSYIKQIKDANDAIPGEEISKKLFRLENVAGKIFDYVEVHPEQFPEIHKFMDYYLPTTLKLLNAYKELDIQPVQGENITNAKKEIEGTMDTINLAFENLLDSLFEDIAMDVSTDISVLETMLAQEGLTKKDF